jgi:hypothetical protein
LARETQHTARGSRSRVVSMRRKAR